MARALQNVKRPVSHLSLTIDFVPWMSFLPVSSLFSHPSTPAPDSQNHPHLHISLLAFIYTNVKLCVNPTSENSFPCLFHPWLNIQNFYYPARPVPSHTIHHPEKFHFNLIQPQILIFLDVI